jgi:hypothetical protein
VCAVNITPRRRLIQFGALICLLAGGVCSLVGPQAQPNPSPASVTVLPPDAFYNPPAQVPSGSGILLRNEPLKDVTLPVGMQGWRILYSTTVDDSTFATAVATVFAPTQPPAGPRPVITWEHGTTGVL